MNNDLTINPHREPLNGHERRDTNSTKSFRNEARIRDLFLMSQQNALPAQPILMSQQNALATQPKIMKIKEKTRYVDEGGTLLSNTEITKSVIKKIKGLYSVDSVTINSGDFLFGGFKEPQASRKIEIKRTLHFYDLIPLGVFLPALCNVNSVYRNAINMSSIQDFLLDAQPRELEVKTIIAKLKATFQEEFSPINLTNMEEIVLIKYRKDATFIVSDSDKENKTDDFIQKLEMYLQVFNQEYQLVLNEGRSNLNIAYWKAKSITFYIPEVLDDHLTAFIETPIDSGPLTSFAISLALLIRPNKGK